MMSGRWHIPVAALVALIVASAAERKLELRGRIELPQAGAVVSLHGAIRPFAATTRADSSGRFRFRNLAPDAYTIAVVVSGQGEVRQTVEVGPAFSDSKGRVEVTVPFHPSARVSSEVLEREGKVSLSELAIPDRAWQAYAEAQKKLGQRDIEGAIQELQHAVELAPQFVAAWNHLGTIAYQSGRLQEAEKYFREALKHDPGAFPPLLNLGAALLGLGKFGEALGYNQRAVRDHPEDALANSQLGSNYFFLGDEESALKYLNAAKRLDPSLFSRPQLLLAEIYLRRSEPARAVSELEDFLARHPEAPNAAKIREQIERLKKP